MTAFSDRIEEFAALNAEVLGVSTDTVFVHRAWIQTPRERNGVGELGYPLASDANQEVSRAYGVLLEKEGLATRGLFIIDPDADAAAPQHADAGPRGRHAVVACGAGPRGAWRDIRSSSTSGR